MKLSRRGKSARRGRHTKRGGKNLRYKGKKVRGSKRYHRGHKRTHKRGRRLQRGGMTDQEKRSEIQRIKSEIEFEMLHGTQPGLQGSRTAFTSLLATDYKGDYALAYKKDKLPYSLGPSETKYFSIYIKDNNMYLHRCKVDKCNDGFEIILNVGLLNSQTLPELPFGATTIPKFKPGSIERLSPVNYIFPNEEQNQNSLVLLKEIISQAAVAPTATEDGPITAELPNIFKDAIKTGPGDYELPPRTTIHEFIGRYTLDVNGEAKLFNIYKRGSSHRGDIILLGIPTAGNKYDKKYVISNDALRNEYLSNHENLSLNPYINLYDMPVEQDTPDTFPHTYNNRVKFRAINIYGIE